MMFDIVIPVGPNDINFINKTLELNKINIINYRNIYIITNLLLIKDKSIFNDCILIDENIFPFNSNTIKIYLGDNDKNKNNWYLQQLIKLYASFVIPNMLDNYLVVDSDTVFLKPTTFFEKNIPLYNFGTEYHIQYFNHMRNLHPLFSKVNNMSGICHHIIFQKYVLIHLFKIVENFHNNNKQFHNNKQFYQIFLESVEKNDILHSGASEYEIYFNFIQTYYPNKYKIRKLKYKDVSNIILNKDEDYVSCHWYMRNI